MSVKENKAPETAVERVKKKLDIETETILRETEDIKESKRRLALSGKVLTPDGHVHTGSAVVHIYEPKNATFGMVIQTMVLFDKDISEVQAGLAMDELRNKMMANYGRKPKRK